MLALVVACVVVARMPSSPVATDPGGALTGRESLRHLFLALLVLAFAAYLVSLALLRRGGRLAPVLAVACAIQLAPLAGPLLVSSDAWTYWSYARVDDPYRDVPADDPRSARWAGRAYLHETSAYGPAFSLASRPVGRVDDPDLAAWLFRLAAALAVLASAWLAARGRAFGAALVGWNPVLAVHFAGGGHNDALMMALVAAALALAERGRVQWAGAAWASSALVKWVSLLVLPLRALEARATGRRVGHTGFAVTTVVTLGLATVLWQLHWVHAFEPLTHDVTRETSYALPHRLHLPPWLFAAAYAVAYLWLLREAARGRARSALALALFVLAIPYLTVWYVVWPLVLAAWDDDDAATLLTLALCAYLLPQRLL